MELNNIVGFKAIDADGNEQNVTVDEMVDMVATRMVSALSETSALSEISTLATAAATGNDVYENELPTVTDAANVRVLQSSGDAAQMTMQSLATKLGGLIPVANTGTKGLTSAVMAKMIGFYMAVSIIKNKYIKISSVKPYNPVFIEVVYVGNVNGYLKTDIYITSAADGIVYVFTSKKDAYGDLDGGLNLYRKGNDLYLLIGDGITGMKDGGLYIRGTEISTDVIDSVDGLTFVKNICK